MPQKLLEIRNLGYYMEILFADAIVLLIWGIVLIYC